MTTIQNPLNPSRLIDVTEAYSEIKYPYGAFSQTGLFTPEYVATETMIATIDDNGQGKMTGFTSRLERDKQRVARKGGKAVSIGIPYIGIAGSVTYEDFAKRVGNWSLLSPKAQAETIGNLTLDRLEQLDRSMAQNKEYLALQATKGLVVNPEDGAVVADLFDIYGYDKVTNTLDLTKKDLDIFAWSQALRSDLIKRNRTGGMIPTVDILVSDEDMMAIQSHPSLALLRASLLQGTGVTGVINQSQLLYSVENLSAHGITQVFDLKNGVRFITYPQDFVRRLGDVAPATEVGKAHTILRGLNNLYRVAFATAPYLDQLGQVGSEAYAWRTEIQANQGFEVGLECSPLYYIAQPDLAVDITIKK